MCESMCQSNIRYLYTCLQHCCCKLFTYSYTLYTYINYIKIACIPSNWYWTVHVMTLYLSPPYYNNMYNSALGAATAEYSYIVWLSPYNHNIKIYRSYPHSLDRFIGVCKGKILSICDSSNYLLPLSETCPVFLLIQLIESMSLLVWQIQ